MRFIILWIILGFLLLSHGFIRHRWITGQTAFTGSWFVGLTILSLTPSSFDYISDTAVLIIVMVHVSFFIGSIMTDGKSSQLEFTTSKIIIKNKIYNKILIYLFWVLIPVGIIGSILMALRIGTFMAVREETLALLRQDLFTQILEAKFYERLMSNMLYPAALLGSICFIFLKRSFLSWLYLILPILGLLLYSLNFGGRGAITIGGLMILWVLIICRKMSHRRKGIKEVLILIGLSILILYFFAFIFNMRLAISDYSKSSITVSQLFYRYIASSIPAFSQWINLHRPLPFIKYDFYHIAPIRELVRFWGFQVERITDWDIVFIPYPYNVFTSLSEQILHFGIIGTVIVFFILGNVSRKLETKSQSIPLIGTRAAVYTYLSFSYFADLSFFSVGWWLTLVITTLILPLLSKNNSL
jgi:oligosaccharide repeat unit polymerase